MTHFVVLESSRHGDQKQEQAERERRDVTIPVEYHWGKKIAKLIVFELKLAIS